MMLHDEIPSMTDDAVFLLTKTNGEGRHILDERIHALAGALVSERMWRRRAIENLTAVQVRCNELLEENRAMRLRGSHEATFCADLLAELARARAKFPGAEHKFVALVEEVGEVAKALLEKESDAELRAELVQVAALAARIAIDGEGDFGRRGAAG